MSAIDENVERPVRPDFMERYSDYLNPILVKETRQALKSRSFVSVFLLMLISSWLISSVGVLYIYGPDLAYASAGRGFFSAYYTVLAIATFLVVPQGAFRSIQSERELQTYEMLTITTLSARKIVWGKWWSSVVQIMVYYAALAPFMVFTNLLRGISLFFIAFVLIWSFIGAGFLAMLAITFSTFTKQKQTFGLLQFLLIAPLIFGLMSFLNVIFWFTGQELPFDQPEFWLMQVIILSHLIAQFVLLRQVATANLMFEGGNRSTPIRITCAIILAISLFWIVALFQPWLLPASLRLTSAGDIEALRAWYLTSMVWLWLVGLFAATEDDRLSRRVRQHLPRSPWLRMLMVPLYPGGGRGMLYLVLSITAAAVPVLLMVNTAAATFDTIVETNRIIISSTSYVLFYIGLTAALGRGLRKLGPELHASHVRVMGILIAAIGIIAPFLFVAWDINLARNIPVVMITNPFYVIWLQLTSSWESPPDWAIAVLGMLGLVLNIRPMFAGFREVMNAPVYAPQPELTAPPATSVSAPSTT